MMDGDDLTGRCRYFFRKEADEERQERKDAKAERCVENEIQSDRGR